MRAGKLLKSADNPGGYPLRELLRRIRMEIESHAAAEAARRGEDPYPPALKVAGHLLIAEAEVAQAHPATWPGEGYAPPRLVPAAPRG